MRAFLILVLAVVSGCVTRVERPEPPRPVLPAGTVVPATPSKDELDKHVVIDPSMDHVIKIVRITSKVSPEGYLKIQLNVQNQTGSLKHFRYRIDWYDQEGFGLPLASTSAMDWTLLSHETSFLAATAPTPAAKNFRVIFAAK